MEVYIVTQGSTKHEILLPETPSKQWQKRAWRLEMAQISAYAIGAQAEPQSVVRSTGPGTASWEITAKSVYENAWLQNRPEEVRQAARDLFERLGYPKAWASFLTQVG